MINMTIKKTTKNGKNYLRIRTEFPEHLINEITDGPFFMQIDRDIREHNPDLSEGTHLTITDENYKEKIILDIKNGQMEPIYSTWKHLYEKYEGKDLFDDFAFLDIEPTEFMD